ncbi:receptor-like serine/threonine-protein kinase ncrk [Phtheirospermum japonicum]|uniref:non-specific serine/threonine protein kinase n=1 Tax=Phtheirospermum japonicum TaxID=374723 RepID=A0A830BJY6_9LAMI|nr:receptor-like serine/threonine-protein kinase ncrk [Phtheirospermum japonicum]
MGLRVEIAILCIINAVWVQNILCDGLSTESETNKWTCTCSITRQENLNIVPANCSSSCDCSPGGSRENRWTCACSNGGFPKLVGDDNGNNCFTACDCNAGTLSELEPSKKWISSKVVIIVLLLCLVIMALAFMASVLWFVHWKVKHPMQWTSPSSDRLTSTSSAINLMSRGFSSVPVYKDYLDSSVKRYIEGCIPKTSLLSRSRRGAIQGIIIQFSYSELESVSNRFSDANLIGVGGSSHVYRGNLRDGRTVAIKRMKTQAGPDAEHVFLSEIELISRIHHCHVVPLIGYCSVNQGKHAERLLVFEYIPNGNLRECLDGDLGECLEWNTRVAIALGAARGLEYLHEAAAPRILHRDVKSTNILLDEKWKAKITDLGMAKHLHNDGIASCSSSPARMQGTFGYFAPEYAIIGRASLKSDVFSFGVVLLELITGRKPIYKSANKAEESLVIWATPRLHDSKRVILELPDPRLKGAFEEEEMHVMAYLAKECLLLDPESRPSMSEVVQILSTIAPDKSKRKNLPLHSFQYSFAGGIESTKPETCDEEPNYTSATEEIKQITFETPARCSSPTNLGSDVSMTKKEKEADDNYSTDIEKLMLLTSKSRSCRLRDDEIVDLTEPRFESFSLPNVDSHIVKVT